MKELTLEILLSHVAHGVKVRGKYKNETILRCHHFINDTNEFMGINSEAKLLLRPLSSLDKPLEELEGLSPIEWFEIGDDENNSIEYDSGNIKLIKNLEGIAKNPLCFQLEYFPYGVVRKLLEWHFDVFGLIESGLAISLEEHGK